MFDFSFELCGYAPVKLCDSGKFFLKQLYSAPFKRYQNSIKQRTSESDRDDRLKFIEMRFDFKKRYKKTGKNK